MASMWRYVQEVGSSHATKKENNGVIREEDEYTN